MAHNNDTDYMSVGVKANLRKRPNSDDFPRSRNIRPRTRYSSIDRPFAANKVEQNLSIANLFFSKFGNRDSEDRKGQIAQDATQFPSEQVRQLARQGGPDLSDLRGASEMLIELICRADRLLVSMSSHPSRA